MEQNQGFPGKEKNILEDRDLHQVLNEEEQDQVLNKEEQETTEERSSESEAGQSPEKKELFKEQKIPNK